jgi:hypothetical protein
MDIANPPSPEHVMMAPARTLHTVFDLFNRLAEANGALVASYLRAAAQATASAPTGNDSGGPRTAPPQPGTSPEPVPVTVESIRARAYELYERRGHQAGEPLEDWRRAEADLRANGSVAPATR